MNKKFLRGIGYLFALLLFVFGFTVFVYPSFNDYAINYNNEIKLENFRNLRERSIESEQESTTDDSNSDKPEQENSTDEDTSVNSRHGEFAELYADMKKYNEDIYKEDQSGLKDAWSYEQAAFDLSKYGIYDNIIGEIRIPKMNCDLPVFLGATRSNMAMGATQLGQTSMPIGGINSNCVIAGHRGAAGGRFFLDIELLDIGDKVYIDNLWETLTYCVSDIKVISPDEIDKVLIQEGKDMLTLTTCHPYPYNYQRYIVYCERIENDKLTENPTVISTENSAVISAENTEPQPYYVTEIKQESNSQSFIVFERVLHVAVAVLLVIFAVVMFFITYKHNKKYK